MSKTEVLSVNHIDLRIIKCLGGEPLYVKIRVSGCVRSSGWRNPELIYTKINDDGVYTFSLMADRPPNERVPVSKDFSVELVWLMPDDFIGVDIVAQENNLVKYLGESKTKLLACYGFGFIIFLFCFFILKGV
jgi:hypothetical protein